VNLLRLKVVAVLGTSSLLKTNDHYDDSDTLQCQELDSRTW